MPPDPRKRLDALDPWAKARLKWLLETERHPSDPRPNQITPDGDWLTWLVLAGRGFGKSRMGAEDVSEFARTHPDTRQAVIAETYGEGRNVCFEGDSGILSVVPPSCVLNWNRSLGELVFTNGSRVDLFTAEKPGRLRGPQFHRAWCDELAKWPNLGETWDMLMFGLRLGERPQCVITTTPKPLGLLKDLIARPSTVTTRGNTFENARNLSAVRLEELRLQYEGTRLGRQELHAEVLDDFEGALWTRAVIADNRVEVTEVPPLVRIGIGLDPSTWGPEFGGTHESVGQGIETGIVAAGIDARNPPHVYVLADRSCRASPNDWAKETAQLYRALKANAVIPEKNNAGWVGSILKSADPSMYLDPVQARQAKRIRAEPVAALYEQGRVHHVGHFPELEDQQCGWDPSENWSPDRVDSVTHCITWLRPWTSRPAAVVVASGEL